MKTAPHSLAFLTHGPEIAAGLFAVLALYAVALLALTRPQPPRGLSWLRGRTLHRDLVAGLTLLAVVPAIGLSLVLASRAAEQRVEHAGWLLQESVASVSAQLDEYFAGHERGIASLAAGVVMGGQFDADTLARHLDAHHRIRPDYLTMLAADADGNLIAATAQMQGEPRRIAGLTHNIRDRPYFAMPMQVGGVFISDAFRGRGIGSDPIVAVSSVLESADGVRHGIVEGSIDLEALEMFETSIRGFQPGTELLVFDAAGRVLYATDDGRYPILSKPVAFDTARDSHSEIELSAARSHIVSAQTSNVGWRVVARLDLRPIYARVFAEFAIAVAWLLATILTAAILSVALARRVRAPLQALKDAVRSLDLDGIEARIEAPPGAPDEIRDVFGHLSTVSERMHNSYRQLSAASEAGKHYREQLEQSLTRRDEEIARRTRELEETNQKLLTLSNVDPLTGLPNRRHLLEMMDRAWRHGMREQLPVSLAVVDVDYFKAYNDSYGHQGGDQCLVRIATAMSSIVGRSLDAVARYGGEEFILLLGNTAPADALLIAERTRQLIEDLALPHKGSSGDSIVTLSCGVAATVPQRGSHYDDLIRLADRALYHAKERGRNRVAWASEDGIQLYDGDGPIADAFSTVDTVVPMD